MRRKKRLNADPEKVRAFLDRGRQGLGRSSQPLRRSSGPGRGKGRTAAARPPEGSEGALRDAVWELDRGRCVNCDRRLRRHAGRWVWHAHHCLPKQTIKRRIRDVVEYVEGWDAAQRAHAEKVMEDALLARLLGDPNGCVLLCRHCHEGHESGGHLRVPARKIPGRVRTFAEQLGPWAEDLLDRLHPEDPAPGSRGDVNPT